MASKTSAVRLLVMSKSSHLKKALLAYRDSTLCITIVDLIHQYSFNMQQTSMSESKNDTINYILTSF